jgi:hypothetical protein
VADAESNRRSRVPFAWLVDWCRGQWRRHHPFAWLIEWWRRRWRRIAVVLLILVAVLLVVRAALDVWVGHRLNDEVARLEKIYGRLDPATLAPPRIPRAENRARVMRAAASLLVVETKQLGTLNWFANPSRQPSSQLMENLGRLLEENQLAVQVAEQGRRRPKSDWEIDYGHDEANLPRVPDVRTLGSVLAASCRVDVEAGRGDQAAEAALAGLAEAGSFREEPVTIIQLIRIAVASEQFKCLRHLLGRGEPSAALLSEVASALAENRTPDPARTAFLGELKQFNYVFTEMEQGRAGNYVGITASPAWAAIIGWAGRPLIRYGRLRFLWGMARIIELHAVAPFARKPSDVAQWPKTREERRPSWWQFVQRFHATFEVASRFAGIDQSGYEYQSQLNAAEVAVALRRFRLDRGKYPDALADLAPQYLAQVPIDPFTGHPPDYARKGAGFELRAHRARPITTGTTDERLFEWKIPR